MKGRWWRNPSPICPQRLESVGEHTGLQPENCPATDNGAECVDSKIVRQRTTEPQGTKGAECVDSKIVRQRTTGHRDSIYDSRYDGKIWAKKTPAPFGARALGLGVRLFLPLLRFSGDSATRRRRISPPFPPVSRRLFRWQSTRGRGFGRSPRLFPRL